METAGKRGNGREASWLLFLDFREPLGKIIPSTTGDQFWEDLEPCFKNCTVSFELTSGPPPHPQIFHLQDLFFILCLSDVPLPYQHPRLRRWRSRSLPKTGWNLGADVSQHRWVMSTFINECPMFVSIVNTNPLLARAKLNHCWWKFSSK